MFERGGRRWKNEEEVGGKELELELELLASCFANHRLCSYTRPIIKPVSTPHPHKWIYQHGARADETSRTPAF